MCAIDIGLRRNAVTNFIDVLGDLRVFDQGAAGTYLPHDRPSEPVLVVFGQRGICRAANIGQIDVGCRHTRRDDEPDGGQHQCEFLLQLQFHQVNRLLL